MPHGLEGDDCGGKAFAWRSRLISLELAVDVRSDPHDAQRALAGQDLRRVEHAAIRKSNFSLHPLHQSFNS